ncbi:AzlD domain-containing protein [Enterococcus sp. LJL98]
MTDKNYWLLILGSGLVTWIPRVLPFVFSRKVTFSPRFRQFLDYLPLCILAALLLQSLLVVEDNHLPKLKIQETMACIPTFIIGYYTKDLMKIVITGIITIALIRLIG